MRATTSLLLFASLLLPISLQSSVASDGLSVPVTSATNVDATSRERARMAIANLPLSFEANQGQVDSHVRFLTRGTDYALFLTATELVHWAASSLAPTAGVQSHRLVSIHDLSAGK